MNIHEASKYSGRAEKTIRRLINSGQLKAESIRGKTGRQYDITQEELDRIMTRQTGQCDKTGQNRTIESIDQEESGKPGQDKVMTSNDKVREPGQEPTEEEKKSFSDGVIPPGFSACADFYEKHWQEYIRKHEELTLIKVIRFFRDIQTGIYG